MLKTIDNYENYLSQHKKIFIYQLNSNPYKKSEQINDEIKKIDYNFNKIDVKNEDLDVEDIEDVEDNKNNKLLNIKTNKDQNYELHNLNIEHLDINNNWIIKNNCYYSEHKTNDFIKHIKNKYLDQSNEFTKDKYKIISETCKIKLDKGIINTKSSGYISTTLLNQSKLYDGITHLTILTDPNSYIISSIRIRTCSKDNDLHNPTYRKILWDLEFVKCNEGYKILGLNDFIHIGLIGLEEIFLDIEYDMNMTHDLRLGWLKLTRCYYNNIIKSNLAKYLYENEETYSIDIIDWIVEEKINLKKEEQMFGNMFDTNYNILRIMCGMSCLCYGD